MESPVSAVDLFCGAGGLTYGLLKAGIGVEAGIDIDEQVEYAYGHNNPGAEFYCWDLGRKKCKSIQKLFTKGKLKLLAACAPCQPFSKLTQAVKNHQAWDLLDNLGRFVKGIVPELVTMENVPELAGRGRKVFDRFLSTLDQLNYQTDCQIVECREYGIPQSRRRLVLLASQLGTISIPRGPCRYPSRWKTVRTTISRLPELGVGEEDPLDPLHAASMLSNINVRRLRATPHDGGNWSSWPKNLVLACHQKESGKSYHSIYGRMWWDRPAPTMTTLCTGIGNGRFGHPDQDRSITLREAALFQSFPKSYQFWPSGQTVNRRAVGRMIGNAVPPKLAEAIGLAIMQHVSQHSR
jgi:DNA (cytosine-5)-methyltransferase 1